MCAGLCYKKKKEEKELFCKACPFDSEEFYIEIHLCIV